MFNPRALLSPSLQVQALTRIEDALAPMLQTALDRHGRALQSVEEMRAALRDMMMTENIRLLRLFTCVE